MRPNLPHTAQITPQNELQKQHSFHLPRVFAV